MIGSEPQRDSIRVLQDRTMIGQESIVRFSRNLSFDTFFSFSRSKSRDSHFSFGAASDHRELHHELDRDHL